MEEKIRRTLLSCRDKKTGKIKALTDRELKQTTNANRTGLYFYGLALKNLQVSHEIVFDAKTRSWSSIDEEKD